MISKLLNPQCAKITGVVGIGIHLYSLSINNSHFQEIYEDFANAAYLRGTLKAVFPVILPYCVSLYSRRKAEKEVQEKINGLERKIEILEKDRN